MKLIVDTNIILSALLRKGDTRNIFTSNIFEFYTLDYVIKEVNKYMAYVIEKTEMTKEEIDALFSIITENIKIVSEDKIKLNLERALDIMKNIDLKDAPIVACSLAIPNDGIWSNDKHFDKQVKIKTYKTKDLIKFLR